MQTRTGRWVVLWGRMIGAVFILGMITYAGYTAGTRIATYLDSPDAVRWQSVISPPEKATKILTASIPGIVVQSEKGKLYSWDAESDPSVWKEMPRQSVLARKQTTFYYSTFSVPNPPDKVMDTAYASLALGENIQQAKYAISDDGKVWAWRWSPSPFAPLAGILLGIGIGLPSGVGLFILIWKVRLPSSHDG